MLVSNLLYCSAMCVPPVSVSILDELEAADDHREPGADHEQAEELDERAHAVHGEADGRQAKAGHDARAVVARAEGCVEVRDTVAIGVDEGHLGFERAEQDGAPEPASGEGQPRQDDPVEDSLRLAY